MRTHLSFVDNDLSELSENGAVSRNVRSSQKSKSVPSQVEAEADSNDTEKGDYETETETETGDSNGTFDSFDAVVFIVTNNPRAHKNYTILAIQYRVILCQPLHRPRNRTISYPLGSCPIRCHDV